MSVVVVGGGVLGLMHALEAHGRGHDVVHLEREPGPRGASVRNFGLVWVGGRAPGPELDLARRARRRWQEIAAEAVGIGFRPHGSLTLASDDAELGLLKEAVALPDAALRGYELLDPEAVRGANPALRGEFAGGLLCRMDAIVEPRSVPGALRAHLHHNATTAARYRWLPGREAVEVAEHAVRDHTGTWHRADLVVLCPGAAHTGIAGHHLAAWPQPPVRRVRLQMMQTAPFAAKLTTSVADGDSLRYYPAYDLPGRQGLAPQAPEAARVNAQLLLVQRLDGSLTIGDTHEYAEPFGFDVEEGAYDHLLARAQRLLGTSLPRVQRRWAGVYSQVTGDALYHRSEVAPGVVLVTGPGGRGMTCAPAIAEQTFAQPPES
ncbi:MAG TPA: TIGR03364 family FAD-dependent oxidoreductase [Streptosporangiaceae bacterium]|nr:TIGR03364 family FAD-dependent oxidoreductase [Streptosporangiaceae bacterium]